MLFDQRYIGTAREENTLNILLEFVPGGSIQSLLGRLGSFPEPVSITYSACTVTLMSWPVKVFFHSVYLFIRSSGNILNSFCMDWNICIAMESYTGI